VSADEALCSRVFKVRGQEERLTIKRKEAEDSREALAKALFER
jgi:hypothetical protein